MIDIAAKTKGNLARLLPQYGVNHFDLNVEKKDADTVSILIFNCNQNTINKLKSVEFIVKHMVKIDESENAIKYEYTPKKEKQANVG